MRYRFLAFMLSGAIASVVVRGGNLAIAQSLPACQPPAPDEYLLLVADVSDDIQSQLQQTLPPTADVMRCQYLELSVTRVGGFMDLDTANAWAQYLTDIGGLAAFVARPPSAAPPSELSNPSAPPEVLDPVASSVVATASPPSDYSPQSLERGYAVLVDYMDDPAVVSLLQQSLSRAVGLVSYGQRPYVLVSYTTDGAIAANTLQTLGDRGFSTMVVNSEAVVLLMPAVIVPQP